MNVDILKQSMVSSMDTGGPKGMLNNSRDARPPDRILPSDSRNI